MKRTFDANLLSRRSILRAMTALAGLAALPAVGMRQARAAMPDLPANFGKGRTVAIVGAGVAGLTAGWKLANAGFNVTVYEADSRYGGRSLTPRPVRPEYREWWFKKYNPEKLFPNMYVSEYHEDARSPDPRPQVCRFNDEAWKPASGQPPVELFFNAGPGRIPSDHVALIELCQKTGVALEPYIFQSNYNLLQSPTFNGGTSIAYNQVNYSLRGQVAEMLSKAINDGHILDAYPPDRRKQILEMLVQFGDLNGKDVFNGSSRLGYSHLPGGWRDAPVIYPPVPLDKTLDSGFVGGGNPETSPGSFLFNADNIDWQNSLMQPSGGMDRVWQRLLVQDVPASAIRMRAGDPRARALAARDAGRKTARRYVGDLVLLNHRVTGIHDDPGRSKIHIDFAATGTAQGQQVTGRDTVDFCFSSMAPNLLATIPTSLPKAFNDALAAVDQTPAIKVGWQARSRFWEKENKIYGGISWTEDIIGQIWYPSDDFNASTGVLTGAYNRGVKATEFGKYVQSQRIAAALKGGGKLHPDFAAKVYADKGLTIAWHYMPFQVGGWASDTAWTQPAIYQAITALPQGRLYLAGDAWSYLPGWQEGAITSVYAAIAALAR
jgi:monoamine oxidase